MQRTIEQTDRRRAKQLAYNEKHNITPKQIERTTQQIMGQTAVVDKYGEPKAYTSPLQSSVAADPVVQYMTREQIQKNITLLEKSMKRAAKELDFVEAAGLRDEMYAMKQLLELKK